MSKKVLLETHNLKNLASGFGVFNHSLLKAFAKMDTPHFDFYVNLKRKDAIVEEFGNRFQYSSYSELQRLALFRSKKVYDVWHCMNQNIAVEPFFKQKKYILTVHDVNFCESTDRKDKKRVELFKNKLKRADLITYISQFAKEHTHQYFDVPNIEEKIIFNGNPISELLSTENFKPIVPLDKPFLYSIGDFLPKKNFLSLVKMMKEIPDMYLIISGNNNKEYGVQVHQEIENLGLQNRVFLTGRVSDEGKQFYIKNALAFVFPSLQEGFGLPPIEAMKFGKPVFLADRASLPEIGGDAAFYWDEFEPVSMKNVLENGLNQFENQKEFYQRKLVERANFFNWDRAAKEYLACYRS